MDWFGGCGRWATGCGCEEEENHDKGDHEEDWVCCWGCVGGALSLCVGIAACGVGALLPAALA